MNKSLKFSLLSLLMLFSVTLISAQSRDRSYIREQISERGECRNVAITKTNGDLMLYGDNGWAASGCPEQLTNSLKALNEDNELIDDVQLTEQGRWLILYGDNGCRYSANIPSSLEQKLIEFNNNGEIITSVAFNDLGDWIVITTEYYSASSDSILEFIQEGAEEFGKVWTTCITDDAVVVVYEGGYRFFGEIPSDLKERLSEAEFDVYRLKISGDAWFFSDGQSNYTYRM